MLNEISYPEYKLEKGMNDAINNALEKIKKHVHPKIVDSLASLLANSYRNDEDAKNIAEFMNLDEAELASLINDKHWLYEIMEYRKEEYCA